MNKKEKIRNIIFIYFYLNSQPKTGILKTSYTSIKLTKFNCFKDVVALKQQKK